jgi:hypothetical protein
MGIRGRLRLPKEHGAWAMLSVPFVLGSLVAGDFSLRTVLLGLSATLFFISRESLLAWWRARRCGRPAGNAGWLLITYAGLGAAMGAPLLFHYHLHGLWLLVLPVLILLAVNTEQAVRREDRTVFGELLAVIGLTITAPAAHYVALGVWQKTALWLWALSALYFVSSVFYVKLRVLNAHGRSDKIRQQMKLGCAFYHSFLLGALLVLAITGSLSLFGVIAFAPALARTGWHLLRPTTDLNLRRIGVYEILNSVAFLAFLTLAFYTV